MKKIALFDTSQGSLNLGDYIINECINSELDFVLGGNFVAKFPTHNPLISPLQAFFKNNTSMYCNNANLKFICGTNILKKNIAKPNADWCLNGYNAKLYKDAILIGCGSEGAMTKTNMYSRYLYKKVLSKKYIHSVRDEETKKFLESLGLKAINTGCVTIWALDKKMCSSIPKRKSESVVFTLTDYKKDKQNDQKLIDILNNEYNTVYFWVQGSGDYEYLKSFKNIKDVRVVYSLEDYRKLLLQGNIDYVGTRLHAGIFAMRNKVRSIIIAIDNRTRDMKKTYNLPSIERDEIDSISAFINSEFETNVCIDSKKINAWKAQFVDDDV